LQETPDTLAALARVMEMSYPPATLTLTPSKALGHRLAAPVGSRNAAPSRPISLLDGYAVSATDLVARPGARSVPEPQSRPETRQSEEADQRRDQSYPEFSESGEHAGMGSVDDDTGAPVDDFESEGSPGFEGKDADAREGHDESDAEDHSPDETEESYRSRESADEDPHEDDGRAPDSDHRLRLSLRPMPQSARREDALTPGYAVAIGSGAEVPRGADYVIPFSAAHSGLKSATPNVPEGFQPYAPPARVNKVMLRREARRQAEAAGDDTSDGAADASETLGAIEPLREWDFIGHGQSGAIEIPVYQSSPAPGYIPIGSWARQREDFLPERAVLRAGEVALLEAMGIDEVEVYRRPVIGIASLAPPLPVAQRRYDSRQSQQMMVTGGGPRQASEEMNVVGFCPLTALAIHMCRNAGVAALPLGFAPQSYRPLAESVLRWLGQVDILMLVGGPHMGPRCLAQDVIAGQGELRLAGVNADPCSALSAGMVEGRPVFSIPGGLPEVLSAFVMYVRPLAHKYNTPVNFLDEMPLALESGSQLRVERDTLAAVRLGWSQEYEMLGTRYNGSRRGDPWLNYVRGQALAFIEAGREYRDGDVVRAFPY
jgi:molybdopterin biosynthesis enzyme